MRKFNFQKQVLPHIIAVVVFFLIVFIFFNPVFLEGKRLKQDDILQWEGMAKEVQDYRKKTGDEALWTNSMFGGMPAYLISTSFTSDKILDGLRSIMTLGLPHPAQLFFYAMLSFYILLLAFKVRPYLALTGAIAYGLSSFSIISIGAGHNGKVFAIAGMPLFIAGVQLAFCKKYWSGFIVAALAMAFQFRANHLQITYYLMLAVIIFGTAMLIYYWRKKDLSTFLKAMGVLILAVFIGLGSGIGRFWTTYEYGAYSMRGSSDLINAKKEKSAGLDQQYAFQNWSFGKLEAMTLLVPNFYGGGSTESFLQDKQSATTKFLRRNAESQAVVNQVIPLTIHYWGPQSSTAGPVYVGAILCFLFIIGLLTVGWKHKSWLIAISILGVLLAWGENFESFNGFLFEHLPGFNKFRAPSMAMVLPLLGIPVLGFLGLERLLQETNFSRAKRVLFISGGIVGGVLLIMILLADAGKYITQDDRDVINTLKERVEQSQGFNEAGLLKAISKDRKSLMRADAFRSFVFVVLVFGILFFTLKRKIPLEAFLGCLVLLVLVDLWQIDRRYLDNEDFERNPVRGMYVASSADQVILQDKEAYYRVFNFQNPFNDAKTSYFHKSVGGYHAAKMRRYQELIDSVMVTKDYGVVVTNLQRGSTDFSEATTFNMLNTKYFKFGDQADAVIENKYAYGNAWFVNEIKTVNNANEELVALRDADPHRVAVVDGSRFKVSKESFSVDSSATIKLIDYKPNELRYMANNSKPGFLVFSDIYYPKGWKAYINGKEASHIRVNYVLRGMEVPAGQGLKIEFKFEPKSYFVGNTISTISSIVLIISIIGFLGVTGKRVLKG